MPARRFPPARSVGSTKPRRLCHDALQIGLSKPHRRFPRPWSIEELEAMTADQPMTAEQAATLKRLAEAAYELEAFQPNLTRAEADLRISMLTAKLKLLDGPPHTL
jgi:hypothetical protein